MRFAAVVFLAVLLLPAVAIAGPLEDGKSAFDHHDYQSALKLLKPLADQGNARAQLYLGEMYEKSDALKQDAEALKWYRRAADQGDAEAQYRLGEMYEFDKEVARNYADAMKCFRKAADQGNASAQTAIGEMYEQGRAVTKDRVEALKWYRKAADQGNAKAQMEIGVRYAKGWDVEQDYVEAYFWLSLAEIGLTGAPANFADAAAINLTPEQKAAVLKRVKEWKPITSKPPAPAEAPQTK